MHICKWNGERNYKTLKMTLTGFYRLYFYDYGKHCRHQTSYKLRTNLITSSSDTGRRAVPLWHPSFLLRKLRQTTIYCKQCDDMIGRFDGLVDARTDHGWRKEHTLLTSDILIVQSKPLVDSILCYSRNILMMITTMATKTYGVNFKETKDWSTHILYVGFLMCS